jgi:hypothetical protein
MHLAPCAFRDPQRRSPGAATNVEQAMIWLKAQPGDQSILLLDRQPTLLSDVLAECFGSDLGI